MEGLHLAIAGVRLAVVVSRFNAQVTDALLEGTLALLQKEGVEEHHIDIVRVPGSFELPLAAQSVIRDRHPDAVICLGALIRGQTDHYHYLAAEVSRGIGQVALQHHVPVVFGVLTTHTLEQALERAGGQYGNKGEEAALTALHMIAFRQQGAN